MVSEGPVQLESLRKVYRVPVRQAGVGAALRSLVRRQTRDVVAVDDVIVRDRPRRDRRFPRAERRRQDDDAEDALRLCIRPAARSDVLGTFPGGASASSCARSRSSWASAISLVWDIPAMDSFELNRAIYRIPPARVPADTGRADRTAGTGATAPQAGAQSVARRAHEVRDRCARCCIARRCSSWTSRPSAWT